METLDGTTWDVIISGTGFSQSLLALALSRSGSKVLHLDKNEHYGGHEAAFSLEEAETWFEAQHIDSSQRTLHLKKFQQSPQDALPSAKLSFSRAYSISLSPQLIYNRSNLLPALVSSKVYQQLEFLAVGNWWIYEPSGGDDNDNIPNESGERPAGRLRKIPSSREDVVRDENIDLRSQRNIMRFLRLAGDADAHAAMIEEAGSMLFNHYLSERFTLPEKLQGLFHALSLSPDPPSKTTTLYALPQVHRHLTSVGLFGPGFGAVIPKWGGLAEIAQVGCRAGAVGGGVYVLNKRIKDIVDTRRSSEDDSKTLHLSVRLSDNEVVKVNKIVGSKESLPGPREENEDAGMTRSIDIISSPLEQLFPSPAEGAAPSAAAVVVFPSGSLDVEGDTGTIDSPPVYLIVHSSDTGECPAGQCVIYGQILNSPSSPTRLQAAVTKLLQSLVEEPKVEVLWTMLYTHAHKAASIFDSKNDILVMPEMPPGLVLEDDVLHNVRKVWESIQGEDTGNCFLQFKEKNEDSQQGEEI